MRTTTTDWERLPQYRRPDRPIFAIGDVHGFSDALEAQLRHLESVIAAELGARDVDLVYLGDYVDRGPDPIGVLELVGRGLGLENVAEIALIGNHDWMLMAAAGMRGWYLEIDDWAVWLNNGGRETLAALTEQSGVRLDHYTAPPSAVQEALGPAALSALAELTHSFRSGDILCVHAGVDPGRPLEAQRERDILWIRDAFLRPAERAADAWSPGVTVVHGHTPNAFGAFAHRIGVDTGGYASGIFTTLELSETGMRFHHTRMA